jgi:hypothetical protein
MVLGCGSAQARVEAKLSKQIPSHAEVDPLEHCHVSRSAHAEMVSADEITPSAQGADDELCSSLKAPVVVDPVASAHSADQDILLERGENARDPVAVGFGIVIGQTHDLTKGGVHACIKCRHKSRTASRYINRQETDQLVAARLHVSPAGLVLAPHDDKDLVRLRVLPRERI